MFLVAGGVAPVLATFLVLGLQSYREIQGIKTLALRVGVGPGHPLVDILNIHERSTLYSLITGGAVSLIFSILMLLWISHRAAGPLYRLRTHLNDLSNGTGKATIRFRNGDYIKDLEIPLNKVFESYLQTKKSN